MYYMTTNVTCVSYVGWGPGAVIQYRRAMALLHCCRPYQDMSHEKFLGVTLLLFIFCYRIILNKLNFCVCEASFNFISRISEN